MPSRLVLLGTGTCRLQADRCTSSVLLEFTDLRVVYDFGRGIATRLALRGLEQDDIRHVVLSHFHPDHLSDLIPYLQAASWSPDGKRSQDLHIWGPHGLRVQMMRVLGLFGPDVLVREENFSVHLHEVRGERLRIESREFEWVALPHAENHGLRFSVGDWTCALTGDSPLDSKTVALLRGVDLGVFDAGHLSDDEIVALASRSQAKRLVASHLYRDLDTKNLQQRARDQGWQGELLEGSDGMQFPIPIAG